MQFSHILNQISKQKTLGALIDLDNTLYEYSPCVEYALEQCHRRFKEIKNISLNEFIALYDEARIDAKKHTEGQGASHSRLLYFQIMFEKFFGKTEVPLTLEFEELFWKSYFQRMKLREGALNFLGGLKKSNIRICIVSDLTARVQLEKIIHLGIEPYVDFVVTSEEAGKEKPEKEIYLLALDKLGLSSAEVVMIGDSDMDEKDAKGAEKLGIKTFTLK